MLQETVLPRPETSSEPGVPQPEGQRVLEDGEIDVVELARLVLREKKFILRCAAVSATLTAIIVYLMMKPVYTADAVFLPPQSSPGSSMSQLANQMGGMIGGFAGLKTPGDVYLGILKSRTVADRVIERFDLQKAYKTKKLSATENTLKSNSKFVLGKDTLITISVEDHDPTRAADLANGYLDALRVENGRLALTEASQRRLFFEQQLEREKNSLADAEVDLKKTQEHTGLIVPVGQAQIQIEEMAQLRAQIASHEVELAAMRQGATDQNPQVVRLQTQITGLQQELQKLQSDPSQHQPGSVQLSTAKVPELALEYVRKQREVKYHEVLFELIAKQYEAARLDESKEAPLLQVVDRATVPDGKSGPHRLLLILASCILGVFVGVSWVILRSFIKTIQQNLSKAPQERIDE